MNMWKFKPKSKSSGAGPSKHNAIITQIEYYFGDMNLPRDKFLQEEMKKDDGWVPLTTLVKFNRLSKISTDLDEIARALQNSDLVEVADDGTKLRRSPDVPLPENTLQHWQEIKHRTVYLKGFPLDATLDEILDFVKQFGEVTNLHMRKTKSVNNEPPRVFKGSIFATFADVETAKQLASIQGLKYGEAGLINKMQDQYFLEKRAEIKKRNRPTNTVNKHVQQQQKKQQQITAPEQVKAAAGSHLQVSNSPAAPKNDMNQPPNFRLPQSRDIWTDDRCEGMIRTFYGEGVPSEGTFAVVAAKMGAFIDAGFQYSEELQSTLLEAHDDLTFCLRLFYIFVGRGRAWFSEFADTNGIDKDNFFACIDVTKDILEGARNNLYAYGMPEGGKTVDGRIKYIASVFVELLFEDSTAHFYGNRLKNHTHNISLEVSERSIIGRIEQYNPFVYFSSELHPSGAVDEHGQRIHRVNFLVPIPLMLYPELPFTSIRLNTEDFPAGSLLASHLLALDRDRVEDACGPDVSFANHLPANGTIGVICPPTSRDIVMNFLRQEMRALQDAADSFASERRNFFQHFRDATVVLGPGLKVRDILLAGVTDSIGFRARDPAQKHTHFDDDAQKSRLVNICQRHGNVESSCVYCHSKFGQIFVVKFASPDMAQLVLNSLPKMDDVSKAAHNSVTNDFYEQSMGEPSAEVDQMVRGQGTCAECSVCLCEPSEDEPFIRHAICGHISCDKCLLRNMAHSTKFPIVCAKCQTVVLLADIDKVLRRNFPSRLDQHTLLSPIVENSIENFLMRNKVFSQCKSDGCMGIFKTTANSTSSESVFCRLCKSQRCSFCAHPYHEDEPCSSFYWNNFVIHNPSIVQWINEQPDIRRLCPNGRCNAPIEKPLGCDHVQCAMCNIHFCWACTDYKAESSGEIYAHMQAEHGGPGGVLVNVGF